MGWNRWVWVVLVVAGCVLVSCAMGHRAAGQGGTLRPVPRIEGTHVEVPRQWEPEEAPRDWKWIVIHHSASDGGGALVFDQWHRKRGFDELGYHFVVDNGEGLPDGNVEVGSRWLKQKYGAHAKSADGKYNQQGIGICLVGNFEKSSPTAAQWEVLVKLVAYLSRKYDIPAENLIGHRDINKTTLCPGKNLDLEKLRKDVAGYLRSAK